MKNNTTSAFLTKICLWAIIWSAGIGILKFFILFLFGFNISSAYLEGMFVSFWGNAFWGVLIGFLIFSKSGLKARMFGYLTGLGTLLFYIASFHYEIAFRSLPGRSLFYYIGEIDHLLPSIKSNTPWVIFLLEVFIGIGCIFIGKIIVERALKNFTPPKRINLLNSFFITLCFVIIFFFHIFPSIISNPDFFWGSRNPILWLVQSSLISTEYKRDGNIISQKDVWDFQYSLGHRIPFGGINKNFPLWSNFRKTTKTEIKKRNVIILILESVGKKEIFLEKNGKPVMPHLRKIAQENLFFKNAYASGTKSNQILPAILSGLPPQTYLNILWKKPLPDIDGLPFLLREYGYKTAYFHGSDLSFEQQRSFLKMVGFDYLFDYDPDLEETVSGWGYDDRTMFAKLKNWISNQNGSSSPYFATLFTLSTHDPFILPEDWQPTFARRKVNLRKSGTWIGLIKLEERYELYQESLHFLDKELGNFYEWYQNKEQPKGTLLVILSDHVTSLHNESPEITNDHMRFAIPIIFAGLPSDLLDKYQTYKDRRVAQYDLPTTLTEYIGIDPLPCDQGLNIFMPEEQWPENRLIYSVGGHNLERFYAWTTGYQVELDKTKKRLHVINYEVPENFRPNSNVNMQDRIIPFLEILFPLDKYLITNNSYTPSKKLVLKDVIPLPIVKQPIFVSHRGNTNGAREKERQNKKEAIEEAITAGFEWLEVDVLITGDGVPIILHDNIIQDEKGNKLFVEKLSLKELKRIPAYSDILTLEEVLIKYLDKIGFLIEIKPLELVDKIYVLNRKVAQRINENPLKHKIIVDSFQEISANFIKNQCGCSVGLDTPYKQKLSDQNLRAIKFSGLDWVYVHYSVADKDLIQRAHDMGLRVMVYTVNDFAILSQWRGNLPDGIITDNILLKKKWKQQVPG